MKHLAALALAALLCANASACPIATSLTERYGISFAGFTRQLPTSAPPTRQAGEELVRVRLDASLLVGDGYRHSAVLNKSTMKAWIVRYGGFAGAQEWYGPVDVDNATLDHCRLEPVALAAPHPR